MTACGETAGTLDHHEVTSSDETHFSGSSPSPSSQLTNSSFPEAVQALAPATQPENTLVNALGFYTVEDEQIPRAVKNAADSVFSIRILTPSSANTIKFVDITKSDIDVEMEELYTLTDKGQVDPLSRQVVDLQIERCRKLSERNQKRCPVILAMTRASAFLAEDGTQLWTNAHVIEASLNSAEIFKNISKQVQIETHQRIPVFIFNQESLLLFDPYADEARLSQGPKITQAANLAGRFYAEDSDYIMVKLSRPIGRPLKIARFIPENREKVFAIGYPACTDCDGEAYGVHDPLSFADRSPGPNSDGKGLWISIGHKVSNQEGLDFFGLSESSSAWEMKKIAIYTADSNYGSSGGPVVNEKGEVFAIHTGGQSKRSTGKLLRRSRGVMWPNSLLLSKPLQTNNEPDSLHL